MPIPVFLSFVPSPLESNPCEDLSSAEKIAIPIENPLSTLFSCVPGLNWYGLPPLLPIRLIYRDLVLLYVGSVKCLATRGGVKMVEIGLSHW